jgi:hypothetical protein
MLLIAKAIQPKNRCVPGFPLCSTTAVGLFHYRRGVVPLPPWGSSTTAVGCSLSVVVVLKLEFVGICWTTLEEIRISCNWIVEFVFLWNRSQYEQERESCHE